MKKTLVALAAAATVATAIAVAPTPAQRNCEFRAGTGLCRTCALRRCTAAGLRGVFSLWSAAAGTALLLDAPTRVGCVWKRNWMARPSDRRLFVTGIA